MNNILAVNLCIFLVMLVFNYGERPVMKNFLRNIGKDFATRNCDFVYTDAQRNMKQLRFFPLLRDIMRQTTFIYFTYIFVQ